MRKHQLASDANHWGAPLGYAGPADTQDCVGREWGKKTNLLKVFERYTRFIYTHKKAEVARETFSDQLIATLFQQHKFSKAKLDSKKSRFLLFPDNCSTQPYLSMSCEK